MAYYFKLPSNNKLNAKQRVAVGEEGAVAITGSPGTGKTVVSIWRHIANYDSNLRKSALLTYTKSLRFFIAQSIISFGEKENNDNIKQAGKNVFKTNSWDGENYDELIIDEAQDIPENELVTLKHSSKDKRLNVNKQINKFDPPINNKKNNDTYKLNGITYRVFRWSKGYINYLKQFAPIISYGADNNQIIFPERATTEERLKEVFPSNKLYTLFRNYRNTYEILLFVKKVLSFEISGATLDQLKETRRGSKPILKLVNNEQEQNQAVLEIIETYNDGVQNIAILVPFVRQVTDISQLLIKNGYELNGDMKKSFTNFHNEKDDLKKINNIHITTFKSSKGLEFQTVIIPDFDKTKKFLEKYSQVVSEKDYFVAFTRAERNLFLISTNQYQGIGNLVSRENFEIR